MSTHSITLTVTVNSPEQWDRVYRGLLIQVASLGQECSHVTISSYDLGVYDDEDYQESLAEVKVLLRDRGFGEVNLEIIENVLSQVGYRFKKEDG